ncbi:MAG: AraC family transcriptional regulator [Zoogloeaceae bacterium]|nr:AraC family transcriptional regulator [Zoogloeaceae bacterium]
MIGDSSACGGVGGAGPERGTISIAFVHEALLAVRARGLDGDVLLVRAGISPALLDMPQARVSSASYGLLWHQIAVALDDEFFGMDRHPMKVGSFTLLCHAIINSDTLERALRRALRFLRVVMDELAGDLEVRGALCRVRVVDLPAGSGRPPARAFAYGTLLLMIHGLACWLVGRRIPLDRASFRCPEPDFSGEWRVLFSPKLDFGQADTAIEFDSAYLTLPNLRNEAEMKRFLREAPANFLVKYRNSSSLTAKIRRHLRARAPTEWPDFPGLASRFHASESTLRRRLEDEGQSYRAILDDLRRDLAISLLLDTDRPVHEIAIELGFAESSAFHRAFKKWTGAPPGAYRHGSVRETFDDDAGTG